jgi:hypothetical protein
MMIINGMTEDDPSARVGELESDKRLAYTERNTLVAFLAHQFPSGLRKTEIEGWDTEWHGCVFIDTPEGQMSWHYHDSDAHLFSGLPPYEKPWDGHTTAEKYARLMLLGSVSDHAAKLTETIAAMNKANLEYLKRGEADSFCTPAERMLLKAMGMVPLERLQHWRHALPYTDGELISALTQEIKRREGT